MLSLMLCHIYPDLAVIVGLVESGLLTQTREA